MQGMTAGADAERIAKVKQYYLSKNITVNEMVKYVMNVQQKDRKGDEKLIRQEKLDKLLQCLVQIVMHKQ
jgi:hypothetical protein